MKPTTLGMKVLGDPSLLRQIGEECSLSLGTADRMLASSPPASRTLRGPATRARTATRSGSTTGDRSNEPTKPPTRLLRVSAVEARTGLPRSMIDRWSAEGSFPPADARERARGALGSRPESDEWIRERLAKSRGGGGLGGIIR